MRKCSPGFTDFLKVFLSVVFLSGLFVQEVKPQIIRKTTVDFYSSDSLLITADHYYSNSEDPYILLFHQENSSRGEYDSIASRFIKMRFNCLSVDLRTGDNYGYVNNLTAARAKTKNMTGKEGAEKDIRAAISYVSEMSDHKVMLLGSSLSATLTLKVASEDERVRAVMAFSPGEYLRPHYTLEKIFEKLTIPTFITSGTFAYPYLLESVEGIAEGTLTVFEPPENTKGRGASLLMRKNPSYDEYWLSVLIFIKSLQI